MVSLRVALAALSLGLAQAQSSDESSITRAPSSVSSASDASSTSSSGPTTHTVAVGASGHRFTEEEVFADVGDIIEFLFYPANHSVIRAEFGFPCIPYEMHGLGREGFYSGFFPVRAITNDPPSWQLRINDTEPIFYYCGADGSCFNNQMIGVINPNDTQTLEAQKEAAEDLTFQVLPGEPYPEEEGLPEPSDAPPSDNDESNEEDEDEDDSGSGGGGLGAGAIAGITIGAVAALLIAAGLLFFVGRRRGMEKAHRRETFTGPPPPVSEAHYSMGPKSPGMDSRWSGVPWSAKASTAEPYYDSATSPGIAPFGGSPGAPASHPAGYTYVGMEAQHTGHSQQTGYMHDSSMGSHPGSPPPGAGYSPRIQSPVPVELPSETAEMPAQESQRYSWSGQQTENNFQSGGSRT